MAMVQGRGNGGDNGPPGDKRPWQPPDGCKNAKGRKEGRNLKLNRQIEVNENKPISIEFDLRDQRTAKPIGPNDRDFTGLIGNEIQSSVPFHFESWDASHFDMAPHRSSKDWEQIELGVEALFKERYKGRKNKLKTKLFGKGNPSDPELIWDKPLRGMRLYDWHKYLKYISSEKFWKKTGAFPDLLEQFRQRHMKGGQWVNSVAETRYNQMIMVRESQEGQEIKLTDEQIVGQVLGESRGFFPGRGRRLSSGASSSSTIGATTPVLDPSQFLDPEEDATGADQDDATDLGGE
ncbi:hypothetical protein Tco_0639331 [Tanacetum coccineum]